MGAAASSRPAPHQMQRLLAGPGSMAMSTSAAPADAKKPPVPLYAAPRIWPGPAGSRSSRRRVGMPGGGKLRRRGGEAAHSRSPLRLNPRLRAHGRLQCPPCACCICCWCRGRRRDAAGDAAAGGQRVAGSGGGSGSEAAAPVPKGGPKALRPTQRCICLRSLPVAREPPWWCERRAGSGCVSRAGLGRSRAASGSSNARAMYRGHCSLGKQSCTAGSFIQEPRFLGSPASSSGSPRCRSAPSRCTLAAVTPSRASQLATCNSRKAGVARRTAASRGSALSSN